MGKNDTNCALLIILILSFADFSSISALKNTKIDSVQLGPNTNLDFTQFLEVSNLKSKNNLIIFTIPYLIYPTIISA